MNMRVFRVDETAVRNLQHFVELIDEGRRQKRDFVRVELDDNRIVAMNIAEADAALPDILQQHRVPSDRHVPNAPGDFHEHQRFVSPAGTPHSTLE